MKKFRRDQDRERPGREEREGEGKRYAGYHKRKSESVRKQANQSGGLYRTVFKSGFTIFAPKTGKSYRVRILPPTWESDDGEYSYAVHIHKGVGADNSQYLCLLKHGGEACPGCEEVKELKRDGHDDDAYKLKEKVSKAMWIIDRDNEDAGPQIWAPSWMVDRDIAAMSFDDRTNETFFIEDPEGGYDLEFKCITESVKGKSFPKVTALRIARRSTPLSDSPKQARKWLDYIAANPIPDCLKQSDYDEFAKELSGGGKSRDEDDDEEDDDRHSRKGKRDEDEDDEPRSKRKSFRDDDEDEEDEDEEDEDDDRDDDEQDEDDEDDRPAKRRRRDDDDDEAGDDEEDDDTEEDDEDEEEPPRKHKKKSSDDEDEDDEPEEDEDDDDGPPPPRKKKKHPPVEDDDEEDEDKRPRKKKKMKREDIPY